MLPCRCKIVSFWRFRGDFICRLCHAGSTRADGGPRRAFPPLIFVGRAASRPVGAACPAAGLPPVRPLGCGDGGCGRLPRFAGLTGTKPACARKALHPPRHSESSAAVRPTPPAPWVWGWWVRTSAAFCSFGGHKAPSQSQSLASAPPQRIIRRHTALSGRLLGVWGWWVRGLALGGFAPWTAWNMQDDEREIAEKRGDGGKKNVNLQN